MSRPWPTSDRRSKPLSTAVPMWAREVGADGAVTWRLYVGDSPGVMRFCRVVCPPGTGRAVAARVLQRCRDVLWDRDADMTLEAWHATPPALLIEQARQDLARRSPPEVNAPAVQASAQLNLFA